MDSGKAPATPALATDVPQSAADTPGVEANTPRFILTDLSDEAARTLSENMPAPEKLPAELGPLRAAHVLVDADLSRKWADLMSAPPGTLGEWKFGVNAQDGGDGCEVRACGRLKAPRSTCVDPPPHRQDNPD